MGKNLDTPAAPDPPLQLRFSDYIREINMQSVQISYSYLMPKPEKCRAGGDLSKLILRPMDIYRLLSPYVGTRFAEQLRAVVPLAAYLVLFQWLVLKQNVAHALTIGAGLLAVMLGLMLFMEGLKLGLMPFGEVIGNHLPRKVKLHVVLGIAFLLGVGVTFAEPAIGALQMAGSIVDPRKAPYLYLLLNQWSGFLVLTVGAGVGLAAVLGTVRFIYNWSLKPLIYWSLIPTLLITAYMHLNPGMNKLIGVAWDCGGVTTGPVTVPLVLSLGIGVASAVARGGSSLSGFGIVSLASIFPILGVLLLGLIAGLQLSPEAILAGARAAQAMQAQHAAAWYETSPSAEIVLGLRAIIPLILFLFFVLRFVIGEKMREAGIIRYGLALALLGMVLFNLGLTYGLAELGSQAGGMIPAAFTRLPDIAGSPMFSFAVGIGIAFLFAWILGFGATLAEPALNALGLTVENLTSGAFKKSMLMYAVSIGVACGIAAGVLKIIFNFELTYLLIVSYGIALALTFLSSEEYVNIAWDSAGVTTGPVTVPLVLAMGLGFGKAVGATDGFGILAAASVLPIISVLSFGLYVQWSSRRLNRRKAEATEKTKGAMLV